MSLITHYPLNGDTLDYSGNNNNAVSNGAIMNVSGKIGKCYDFNGITAQVTAPTAPIIQNLDIFTMAMWIKPDGVVVTGQEGLIGTPGFLNGFCLYIRHAPGVDIGIQYVDALGNRKYWIGGTIDYTKWTHIATSWDGLIFKIYVNGIMVTSGVSPQPQVSPRNIIQLSIGYCEGINSPMYFDGKINDVRIYDNVLSDKEIYDLSKAKVLHYKFNDFQEPTTNLISSPTDGNTWNTYTDVLTRTTTKSILASTMDSDGSMVSMTADSWISAGGSDSIQVYRGGYTLSPANNYCLSVWVNVTVACSIAIGVIKTTSPYTTYINAKSYNLTPGWNRISVYGKYGIDVTDGRLQLSIGLLPVGATISFYKPQLEAKDHATPFVDGSRTGKLMDNSGYNRHSVIDDGLPCPTWVNTSKRGSGAYKFNGLSNVVVAPHAAIPDNSSEFTTQLWAYWDGTGGGTDGRKFMFESYPVWTTNLFMSASNNVWANVYYSDTSIDTVTSPSTLPINTWVHFVITFKRNGYMRMYIDGLLCSEIPAADKTISPMSGFKFGSYRDGNERWFGGMLDDFRVYTSELSASEVLSLYNSRFMIDDKCNLYVDQVKENCNIAYKINEAIKLKNFSNGLSKSSQLNCVVTLQDNGIRIYRPPNLIYPDAGNTMWGGLKFNLFDIDPNILMKGRKYRISFNVSGKSSNDILFGQMYFTYTMGYSGGPLWGLTSVPATNSNTLGYDFQGSKRIYAEFDITDDIWKVSNTTYNGIVVAGTSYNCYRELCWGFPYSNTGSMGTDLFITDFRVEDITTYGKPALDDMGVQISSGINEVGPTDGLVSWMPLTSNLVDKTGNPNTAVSYGPIITQYGAKFEYTTQNINLLIPAKLNQTMVTLSAWVKSDDITRPQNIISKNGPLFLRITGSTLRIGVLTGADVWTFKNGTIPLQSNTWLHLVLTYDGIMLKGYVNGVLDVNTLAMVTGDMRVGSPTVGIYSLGYTTGGEDAPFGGYIRDVRFYNKSLNQEDVQILYKIGVGNTPLQISDTGKVYIGGRLKEV
jgi:hypothetical protein